MCDRLLGLHLGVAIELIKSAKLEYCVSETLSPKRDESLREKRIVRARKSDNRIDLTIGYF